MTNDHHDAVREGSPVVVSADDSPPTNPADAAPESCPVCGVAYDSVSHHETGLLVNLIHNDRYRRVCFEPIAGADGRPLVRFFHHTHAQTALEA